MSKSDQAVASVDDAARAATQPLSHHGRTLAAWVGSIGAFVGFLIASIGAVMNLDATIMTVGIVIVLASAAAGGVLHKLGYGVQES